MNQLPVLGGLRLETKEYATAPLFFYNQENRAEAQCSYSLTRHLYPFFTSLRDHIYDVGQKFEIFAPPPLSDFVVNHGLPHPLRRLNPVLPGWGNMPP